MVFLVFGALTAFVTYMKNARILDPSSPIAQHFAPAKWLLVMHGFAGALAMFLGAFQFSNRLRALPQAAPDYGIHIRHQRVHFGAVCYSGRAGA